VKVVSFEEAVGTIHDGDTLPQGALSQLVREMAAGRPGLLSHVGLHSFVNPRGTSPPFLAGGVTFPITANLRTFPSFRLLLGSSANNPAARR
jgi:acyl CoA:acetate/3-ketoacid CoA transferase